MIMFVKIVYVFAYKYVDIVITKEPNYMSKKYNDKYLLLFIAYVYL